MPRELGTRDRPLDHHGEQVWLDPLQSDPEDPADGEVWLREDLADAGENKLGELRFYDGSVVSLDVFELGQSETGEHEVLRCQLNGQTGFVPVLDLEDARTDRLRFRHGGQTLGVGRPSAIPDSALLHYPYGERTNSTIAEELEGETGIANGTTNISDSDYYRGHAESGDGVDDYIELTTWLNFGSQIPNGVGVAFTLDSFTDSDAVFLGSRSDTGVQVVAGTGENLFYGNYTRGAINFSFRDENGNGVVIETDDTTFNDGGRYRVFCRNPGGGVTSSDLEIWINGSQEAVTTGVDQGLSESNFSDFDRPVTTHAGNNQGSIQHYSDCVLDNPIPYLDPSDTDIDDDYQLQPWS